MSATLNAECFSEYFGGAPIISIPGRAQPVTEFRLEDCLEVTGHIVLEDSEYAVKNNGKDNSDRLSKTSLRRLYPNYSKNVINSLANVDESLTNYVLIGDLLEYICKQGEEGAVLIFLPGMAEIKTAMEEISKREYFQTNNTVIYPLHSSLSNAEQIAIFQRPPKGKRKIVFSSNIAETSITIDDVVFVIDSGRVKENRYDDLNMMPTLSKFSFYPKMHSVFSNNLITHQS
jgi:ATP-dependent RNA helicase DHX36